MGKVCINTNNSAEVPISCCRELVSAIPNATSLPTDGFYLDKNGKSFHAACLEAAICYATKLPKDSFYMIQNGRRLHTASMLGNGPIRLHFRLLGGKGGFGSMLRAIGAQIEKTTNREACRDLSGRRLRDINEEKRLKAWLDKQGEREREAEERKKRKIQKLLVVPKHEFKDDDYEEARSKLTEKVCDAVEEGLKKDNNKRKINESTSKLAVKPKKKKALWLDDDLSDGSESSDTDSEVSSSKSGSEKSDKLSVVASENAEISSEGAKSSSTA